MCGVVGWVDFDRDLAGQRASVLAMTATMTLARTTTICPTRIPIATTSRVIRGRVSVRLSASGFGHR